jgi:hypothetical protein
MMGAQFAISNHFCAVECCHAGCGITFAIPRWFDKNRRDDHKSFYCPNGHSLSFHGASAEERLRQKIADVERSLEFQRRQRQLAERQARAYKGERDRVKRRVANGVCPCCQRSFQNLRRHMTTQHLTVGKP